MLCLAQLPGGDVIAAGSFTTAGGQPCANIARFDGVSWSQVGTGLNGHVRALLVLPGGDLVAGGDFYQTGGGAPAARVARFDGTSWTSLGSGFASGSVQELARLANGEVVAGGVELGSPVTELYRFDGSIWIAISGFDLTAPVVIDSLATLPGGELAIGGSFDLQGSAARIGLWDGVSIQPLPTPFAVPEMLVHALGNGDLLAHGVAASNDYMARWNGSSWTFVQDAPSRINMVVEDSAGRIVAGAWNIAASLLPGDGMPQHSVQRLETGGWVELGAPMPPVVNDIVTLADGSVVVGGSFDSFGGVPANNLARWDGTAWLPLGTGVDGEVFSMTVSPTGELVVSGEFVIAGGQFASAVASWNGSNWSPIGGGLPVPLAAISVSPDASSVAGVIHDRLYVFDGTSWSLTTVPGMIGGLSIAFLDQQRLAIGAVLVNSFPGPFLAMVVHDNGVFTPVQGSVGPMRDMLIDDNGDLVVADGVGVRSWDGTSWTTRFDSMTSGTALARLPNGGLLMGSNSNVQTGGSSLWRERNGIWEELGPVFDGWVTSVAATERGEVFPAGTFTTVNGAVSVGFAEANATCPATVTSVGVGCVGSAGPVALQAQNRPWLGGSLHTTTFGLPANSIAVQTFGVQPASVPLPGTPPANCLLYTVPLANVVIVPQATGLALGELPLPANPALAGLSLRIQTIGVEFGAGGVLTALTSSNALECTLGTL